MDHLLCAFSQTAGINKRDQNTLEPLAEIRGAGAQVVSFRQRAKAAFRASALRCLGVICAIRAWPPSRRIRFSMRGVSTMPASAGIALT
jgi:hypothetical protein